MHFPALILDLAVILGVAAVVTFVFRRIKQPVVLGYIASGVLVGKHSPALFSVTDTASIRTWAELGVIFLMFALGLEFSFRRLARVGISAVATTMVQILGMMTLGITTARILNLTSMDQVFLGCMISISSTTIILKAFDELRLKSKKFAELVFGILIVEDLAAILMLVALTNFATTATIGSMALVAAFAKLALVIGAWFVIGMFVVPRFVKVVGIHGTDEMLTVVSIALCLALVALAVYFQYSVALGAFIMGSILAESTEAKRIEHLVGPLKDIFGAVFFISVGMLLEPAIIMSHFGSVILISAIIICGNVTFVTLGSLATGQSVRSSVQTGFSMAQIGEFSFIIAALGANFGVISAELYPIIVAASLITTFTTPYLIKFSFRAALVIENKLPRKMRDALESYGVWIQRRFDHSRRHSRRLVQGIIKWLMNAVVVASVFIIAANRLVPWMHRYVGDLTTALWLSWVVAFVVSAPCIWAMLFAFRNDRKSERADFYPRGGRIIASRIVTVGLIGGLSIEYFPALITLTVTLVICGVIFWIFRGQIENYYRWIEVNFRSGFEPHDRSSPRHQHLAPWDAHLVEVNVPPGCFLVGLSLIDLKIREKFGLNIVVLVRGDQNIVAPKAREVIYPGDKLLCFGTDAEIERFRDAIEAGIKPTDHSQNHKDYSIRRFKISVGSRCEGMDIRSSGFHETYDCIVVGLERGGERIRSPRSDTVLSKGDILWMVGANSKLDNLSQVFL